MSLNHEARTMPWRAPQVTLQPPLDLRRRAATPQTGRFSRLIQALSARLP